MQNWGKGAIHLHHKCLGVFANTELMIMFTRAGHSANTLNVLSELQRAWQPVPESQLLPPEISLSNDCQLSQDVGKERWLNSTRFHC